jgi:hypothetical protein
MRWLRLLFVLAVGATPWLLPARVGAQTLPEFPREYVDTTYVPPSGSTLAVLAGGDFQAALNAAQPGDVITLEAGATFTGPFMLPNKAGIGWIIVRTSEPDSRLPFLETRVTPDYAYVMPKLRASEYNDPAIVTDTAAHHFRFIGIEIQAYPTPNAESALIMIGQAGGTPETSVSQVPHHIIFDRCYIHGNPGQGTRGGLLTSGANIAVIDSDIQDIKWYDESWAVLAWGPGPYKLVNNYLEAAGINVMFGGVVTSIPNNVPTDIEVRRSHFFKRLSWKEDDPSYEGTSWGVKNLFELKSARRVLLDGNLFEHIWAHAQAGFALMLTPRDPQYPLNPWSAVQDITIMNNILRHIANGIAISGRDTDPPDGYGRTEQTQRVLIKNNLFEDMDPIRWPGLSWLFSLSAGIADLTIEHNTGFPFAIIIYSEGTPNERFIFRDNLLRHGAYGIFASGTGTGKDTLNTYFPGAIVRKNVFAGEDADQYEDLYPPDNFFLASLDQVGFVNYDGGNGGDYRLVESSPYKNAGTDGKDIGVDFDMLTAAMGGP